MEKNWYNDWHGMLGSALRQHSVKINV
ncbi:unnamed protein product [Spirodela intermedia]|uniref:Uncharacterized protein n=2 Tax=Spirodela intermedia TaxID=51605 RepID=A0A7I8J3Y3_SPIIN|nr:unnamed protein product [Spirodela intermedia]CAA6664966.1 unnamed protein product [Spirodela intermedia]CAA7401605.1 unnamed protein product [Spirodela intermedia]